MAAEANKRVRLRGGPERTSSTVEITPEGRLIVEWYDFSDEAEEWFGHDVAYQLIVEAVDKETLLARLREEQTVLLEGIDTDALLLHLLAEHFESYFEVQRWFQERAIPHEKRFESWA